MFLIQALVCGANGATSGKFYRLLPDKENTVIEMYFCKGNEYWGESRSWQGLLEFFRDN